MRKSSFKQNAHDHVNAHRFCYLYKDNCAWPMRLMAYVPSFSTLSENMAMTMSTLANEPIAPVVSRCKRYKKHPSRNNIEALSKAWLLRRI